ncbi:MAG TPA: glycosyltransferase family 39 protein [Solirubrobacterales bacterium]|nr:glycosyltransferase family 39 protein [Solirubrobacterales bacterium]
MARWGKTVRGRPIPDLLLLAAIAVLFAWHVVWLARFSFGYVTEWDESGYISIALRNSRALTSDGPFSLISTVLDQGVQAPFVPLSAVPFNVVFGSGVDASLLVEPTFFALLLLATYAVARRLTTPWWALLAAIVVGTAPVVSDYTRIFHFSVPAAAFLVSALWALMKSEGLTRRRWAVACGLLLGLMVLSRSMTIGYLPGFAAAAALPILFGDERRERLVNFVLLCLSGAVLAGLWYLPNAGSVGSYLLNFGYGAESEAYGAQHSKLSVAYWTREIGAVFDELYFPLGVALALGAIAALASALVGRRPGRPTREEIEDRLATDAALAAVIVLEGYVALTSSKNQGTAFALPWLPILIVLVCAAVARVRWRSVKVAAVAVFIAVAVFNFGMKSGFVPGLGDPRTADVPLLGETPVSDGRGIVEAEVEGAGYPAGSPTEPMPQLQKEWLPFAGDLAAWVTRYSERKGEEPNLGWGFDDLLLNNTRVALGSELELHRELPTVFLKPFPDGDSAASYRAQLEEADSNLLVVGERGPGVTGIHLSRRRVEAAGRQLGFSPVHSLTAPDGREVTVWWRGPNA